MLWAHHVPGYAQQRLLDRGFVLPLLSTTDHTAALAATAAPNAVTAITTGANATTLGAAQLYVRHYRGSGHRPPVWTAESAMGTALCCVYDARAVGLILVFISSQVRRTDHVQHLPLLAWRAARRGP